jgi:hypothetical protein
MNIAKWAVITIILVYGTKWMTKPKLRYFSAAEFGIWWPLMADDLLIKLDAFRELWGAPVRISPAAGGIGRHLGINDTSQHNVDRWGEVRAIDVFPDGMNNRASRERAYQLARQCGFTGIGLYTDTMPQNLLHVDVRKETGGRVATWARVAGQYVGIGEVIG